MDKKEEINQIISDVFGIEPSMISDNTTPDDIPQWDSLNLLNLVLALEDHFNISISADEIGKLYAVSDIVSLVNSKR